MRVRSGGQTGVDRAALDAAMACGIEVTGWCPRGRLAENGSIPARYPLVETSSDACEERTRLNVDDSDATLIITIGPLVGGTELTARRASQAGKPVHVVDLDDLADPRGVSEWLTAVAPADLNVAGPRESEAPGIYVRARDFLREVLCANADQQSGRLQG